MTLTNDIIILEYSEKQRNFHFGDTLNTYATNDWIKLKAMTYDDAFAFCRLLDKKYVENRITGKLPEMSVVKLELELFSKLKNIRMKYAGR